MHVDRRLGQSVQGTGYRVQGTGIAGLDSESQATSGLIRAAVLPIGTCRDHFGGC